MTDSTEPSAPREAAYSGAALERDLLKAYNERLVVEWEKAGFTNPAKRDAALFGADVISYLASRPVTDAQVLAGAMALDPDAFEVPPRGYGRGAAQQAREWALSAARDVLEAARAADRSKQ